MKKLDNIDRNRLNSQDVTMTDVPRSGYNLTYMNHDSMILGRLIPTAYHHCMPADKISGSTESEFTFDQVSTPVMGTMSLAHHNFLVTLRSINTEWEKFMTPTKLNGMNSTLVAPSFTLWDVYSACIVGLFSSTTGIVKISAGSNTFKVAINNTDNRYTQVFIPASWKHHYVDDVLHDLREQLFADVEGAGLFNTSTPTKDILSDTIAYNAFKQFFIDYVSFFCGKRSLLDKLGYQILPADVISNFFDLCVNSYKNVSTTDGIDVFIDNDDYTVAFPNSIKKFFDDGLFKAMNEYAIRAYYAIWFEYYRNYDLEPRSNDLSEYHSFGASSIITGGTGLENLHFLALRPRAWSPDAFTKAGIDDISRYVFAPIMPSTAPLTVTTDTNTQGLPSSNPTGQRYIAEQIAWVNPNTGTSATVNVPIPSRLLSQLQSPGTPSSASMLQLFTLKKAKMLENYLKRLFYGGDEYRDRMLSLYGAKIEDYRINRPKWLSSSYDEVSPTQQIANSGAIPGSQNGGVIQGQRVATASVSSQGSDGYTQFVPENAIVIGITSIVPRAQYDVLCPQNLQLKYTDFPIPQFANNMDDTINTSEVSRSSFNFDVFGYSPYGHAYRYRVDEVHGDYLDSRFDYTFSRFFKGLTFDGVPKLNYKFIHCRPLLPMFVNQILLDGQAYGKIKNNFLVERPLPTPVEVI